MKTKKIIATLLAGALATTAVVSASAATLTDEATDYSTEVTAKIEEAAPGEVSYVITIPDKVDFGTLTQPETEVDSNKYISFEVEATEIQMDSGFVSVYINGYKEEDEQFYITQKDVSTPFEIPYDIYYENVNDNNIDQFTPINEDGAPGVDGYHFTSFQAGTEGAVQPGTLVLNQKALYGQELDTIAGDYSGTIIFRSTIRQFIYE